MQACTHSHENVTGTVSVSKTLKGYRRVKQSKLNSGQEAKLELKPRSFMLQAVAFC